MKRDETYGWSWGGWIALLAGLVTTLAALAVVRWAAGLGPRYMLMSRYWLFVVPVGVLGVAALAASGYALVSWILARSGRSLPTSLGLLVLLLQLLAYGGAHWLEYQGVRPGLERAGSEAGFLRYCHHRAVTLRLQNRIPFFSRDVRSGELGSLGYFFRMFEIAIFLGVGWLASAGPGAWALSRYASPTPPSSPGG